MLKSLTSFKKKVMIKSYIKDFLNIYKKKYFDRASFFRWYVDYKKDIRNNLFISSIENIVLPNRFKTIRSNNSRINIDIVILLVEKDLITVTYVLKSIKKHVLNPINEIVIISPENKKIKTLCKKNKLKYVNEKSILGYPKEKVEKIIGKKRAGWYYQQLLKLGCDKIVNSDHFLIIDADTIICKDRVFVDNKLNNYLDFSDEFHQPYYKNIENLTGIKHNQPVSFISHYMIFNKKYLQKLKELIEKKNLQTWDEAIINSIDLNENSSFSEYELYSNFILEYYPRKIFIDYWHNKSFSRKDIEKTINNIDLTYKYKSISFHSYDN